MSNLPKTRSLSRTIQRKLRHQIEAPRNVDNHTDLVIPAEIVAYEGASILQFDSGLGEDRILIFGNTKHKHTLNRVKHISLYEHLERVLQLYHNYLSYMNTSRIKYY